MNVNPFGHLGDNLNCIHCHHQLNQHWQDNDRYYRCPHCPCKETQVTPLMAMPAPKVEQHIQRAIDKETRKMSAVNLCDRCNAFALGKAIGEVLVSPAPNSYYDGTQKKIELCPECVGELMAFLDADVKREGTKAYKEPWQPKELESGE